MSSIIKSALTLSIVLVWLGCSVGWVSLYIAHMPHLIWWLTVFLPVEIVSTVIAYGLHWMIWDIDCRRGPWS